MTSPRQSSRACRCSFATPRSRPASFARCRRRKPCGRCMSVSGDFVGVEERRVPSDVAVAHKDGGHGQCRRQGRAELAGVLFRGGLLIRDDCMGGHGLAWCFGRCRRRAPPIAGPSIGGVGGGGSLKSTRRISFLWEAIVMECIVRCDCWTRGRDWREMSSRRRRRRSGHE